MGHTSFQLDRRQFLKAGLGAAGALAFSPGFLARALAAGPVTVGDGPYGPLQPFDANGIALPAGFSSREIARGGTSVPGSTPPYVWHNATDGQATFRTITAGQPDGGWILVANSEMPAGQGGVSAVEFGSDAGIERAYRVLAGTSINCAVTSTVPSLRTSSSIPVVAPRLQFNDVTASTRSSGFIWRCGRKSNAAPIPRAAAGPDHSSRRGAACGERGSRRR